MHSHGSHAQFATGTQDAKRDFATVGDEYFLEHDVIFA
jgi:hypothetical protein